ncbi:hypothetical protein ACFWAR_13620 [Streptomyces sp. NPDC059917]|uniref:hypothetical protein n=1 Tax=Streptomyces sp. NPDC059917 TaxID=3347002 RepID=UPI003648B177
MRSTGADGLADELQPPLQLAGRLAAIDESPALRAREREIGERAEVALGAALAGHPPHTAAGPNGAAHPVLVLLAGAIAGTHRAALRELRRRILSGEPPADARDGVTAAAARAFDGLCRGLHADLDRAVRE